MKAKRILLHVVITVIAIGAALILAEYILRFLHPFTPEYAVHAPYTYSCYGRGSYYWFRFLPNKACTLHSNIGAFPDVTIATNTQGLRNGPITMPKPPGRKRVLFIGDSFVTGWGVPANDALPAQTQMQLSKLMPGADIETINAGLPGSGPSYYYLYLQNDGLNLDPDVIVVGFYLINDIMENVKNSVWTKTDANGLPLKAESTLSYVDYSGTMRIYSRPIKRISPILEQSYLYDLVTDALLHVTQEQIDTVNITDIICLSHPGCHDLDQAINRTKQLFLAMRDIAKRNGKQLLVVIIPAEYQVYQGKRLKFGIPVALSPEEKAYPDTQFSQFFAQNGIPSLDLLPAFKAQTDQSLYFPLDIHWNSAGHTVAAASVAAALVPILNSK